jgi:hypothetical protein
MDNNNKKIKKKLQSGRRFFDYTVVGFSDEFRAYHHYS